MATLVPLVIVAPLFVAAFLMGLGLPRWLVDSLAIVTALAVTVACAVLAIAAQDRPVGVASEPVAQADAHTVAR